MSKSIFIQITAGDAICEAGLNVYYQKPDTSWAILPGTPGGFAVSRAALISGQMFTGVPDAATTFKVIDEDFCEDDPCYGTEVILVCTTTTTAGE